MCENIWRRTCLIVSEPIFTNNLHLYFLEELLSGAVFITQVCLWLSMHILHCTSLFLHCKEGLVCIGRAAFRKNKWPIDAEPEMELYHLVLDESLFWRNAVHKTCFCYTTQSLTKKGFWFCFYIIFFPAPLPIPSSFHHEHVQSSCCC